MNEPLPVTGSYSTPDRTSPPWDFFTVTSVILFPGVGVAVNVTMSPLLACLLAWYGGSNVTSHLVSPLIPIQYFCIALNVAFTVTFDAGIVNVFVSLSMSTVFLPSL